MSELSSRILRPENAVDNEEIDACVKRINAGLRKGERRFPVPPGYRERIEQMMRDAGWPVMDRELLEPTAYGTIVIRT